MSAERERALEALEYLGSFAFGRAQGREAEARVLYWTDVVRAALRSSEPQGERIEGQIRGFGWEPEGTAFAIVKWDSDPASLQAIQKRFGREGQRATLIVESVRAPLTQNEDER